MGMIALIQRAVYSLLTLYMMLILLAWLGPWLQLDLNGRRLRWIRTLTEPLTSRLRKWMSGLGPLDLSPVAALFLVWVIRQFALLVIEGMVSGQ